MLIVTVNCGDHSFLIHGDERIPEQVINFEEWDEWGSVHDEDAVPTYDWRLLYDEDGLTLVFYPLIDDGSGGLIADTRNAERFVKPDALHVLNRDVLLQECGEEVPEAEKHERTITVGLSEEELNEMLFEDRKYQYPYTIEETGEEVWITIVKENYT